MPPRSILLGILVVALLTPAAHAQGGNLAEQYLFSAANRERTAHGIALLHLDPALTAAARLHAEQMAAHQTISHRFSGEPELSERGSAAGASFSRIAENVAEAPSPLILHDAWMRSPGHRENLLDPRVSAVGIAVVRRHGQLYAVQDFANLIPALTFPQQEAAVAVLLEQSGLTLLPESVEARATCNGSQPATQPAYILRYTTDNPATLPSRLLPRLASRQFRYASVGACPDATAGPFAAFRLAILLYP